jgi:hypothetical protein
MLEIGRLDRHLLSHITSSKMRQPRRVLPSRASGFVHRRKSALGQGTKSLRDKPPTGAASAIEIVDSGRGVLP